MSATKEQAALMRLRVELYGAAQLLKGDDLAELKQLIGELVVVLANLNTSGPREPLRVDPTRNLEADIVDHTIARARLRQPLPSYRVGDRAFDRMVLRLRLSIEHDDSGPYTVIGFGASVARVYAAGPLLDDNTIEVIEPPEVAL